MLIIFDLDDTLYDRIGQLKDDLTGLEKIKLYLGVKDFLQKTDLVKILVTKGNQELQFKKLEILGLKSLFDQIIVCSSDEHKKSSFNKILQKYPDKKILVIGDRVNSEIRYANQLGLKTVLLNQGKYKNLKAESRFDIPNWCYQNFKEFVEAFFSCKQ